MPSVEGTEPVSNVYKDHNLHVLWGVTLMAVLGVSSVTPAFPAISREFGISGGQVGLLITVFTLPGVVLTPVLGVLSDRHGRKRILVPALLLFGAAGGACVFALVAVAPSLPLLLVPAVLFGVAQGINLPNILSLLNAHAPNENRGAFMATNGISLRAGQTIGPLLMASLAGTLGVINAYLASAGVALASVRPQPTPGWPDATI